MLLQIVWSYLVIGKPATFNLGTLDTSAQTTVISCVNNSPQEVLKYSESETTFFTAAENRDHDSNHLL